MSRSYRSIYGSRIYVKYTRKRLFRLFSRWNPSDFDVYILPNRQNGKKTKREELRACRRSDKKWSRQRCCEDIGSKQLKLMFRRTLIHKGS